MDHAMEENFELRNHAKRFKVRIIFCACPFVAKLSVQFKSHNETLKEVHLPVNFHPTLEVGVRLT